MARVTFDGLTFEMALRYVLRSERRFARLIGWVSFGGLFLGVIVLTVVVSVMNGFDAELKARLLGSVPHVLVIGATVDDPRFADLPDPDRVRATYAFYSTEGMVAQHGAVNPVAVFATDAEAASAMQSLATSMIAGDLAAALAAPDTAVLGAPLAAHLGLRLGDPVLLMVSEATGSGARPRLVPLVLRGTFEIGGELDYNLLVTARAAFSEAQRRSSGRDGVRIQLADPLEAPGYALRLRALFPDQRVESWADSYGELFSAVRLEKGMMFVILLLVVAVAGFNIVSGQTMIVHDKRADIAILRTMGATSEFIRAVFLWQGVTVATAGIVAGLAAGFLLAWNIGDLVAVVEEWVGFRILEGTYFVRVPSRVQWSDLAVIGVASWLICALAAWLPARRAALANPVVALHGG